MSLHLVRIAMCLLGLAAPAKAVGQTPASDSTGRSARDSSLAPPDSANSAASASAGDSISAADTSRSASDTSRPAALETTGARPGRSVSDTPQAGAVADSSKPPVAAASPPVDSILSEACSGSAAPTSTARDLLVVVFAPEAGRSDRMDVARSVKGRLLGAVSSEPGAYYLWVPAGGREYQLRAAADQLVRWPAVRQVGSRACPSPAPVESTPPKLPDPQPPGS